MGQGYLLDTNTIVDYCGGKLPEVAMLQMHQIVDKGFSVSPVVKIEVLGFSGTPTDMQKLEGLINLAGMLYINDEVINTSINLRKSKKIKLGDAIIAATAIANGRDLITRNTKDFNNISGLTVIDPYLM